MNNRDPIKTFIKRCYFMIRGIGIRLLIYSRKISPSDPHAIRSILIIRIDRIGDIVLSLPAIKAMSAMFPQAKITVLASPSSAPLLKGLPYIAEVLPYEGFWRSAGYVHAQRFDIAVDLLMDYSIRTALIAYASRSPVRAGFDIEGRGRFFNITVLPDHKAKHMSEHILDVARAVGRVYKTEDLADWDAMPRLLITPGAAAEADELLRKGGIHKDDRVVGIHPGGHFPSQCWMPASFAELADRITEKENAKIVIIGSSAERGLIEGIVAAMKTKPVKIIGAGIDVVAAVIAVSDLIVCNNSGLLHIAGAVGTPTVSTMGPTVPHLWWPLGSHNTVIRHDLPCSPCGVGRCDRHECMKSITVDEMEDAVIRQLLERGQRQGSILKAADTTTILVINLGGIGDVILSTPALRSLKSTYAHSKIYFLGVPRVSEFVKKLAYIDRVFAIDLDLSPISIVKNIETLYRIRKMKIRLAINMRTLLSKVSALKIRLLLGLVGAKITAGRDTEGLGSFFDIRISESRHGDKSEMEYDLDMVKALGCDIVTKRPDLLVNDTAGEKVRAMLASGGVENGDILIGIHPGGKRSHRWAAENFAAVIDGISVRKKTKFIITGDLSDAGVARKIAESAKTPVIDSTGKLNLAELTALIRRCNLYICNDTASMHIAAVLRVPLVAVFGPGYLTRFDPRAVSKDAVVITSEASCAPCDRIWCSHMKCLKSIPADRVLKAAMGVLDTL